MSDKATPRSVTAYVDAVESDVARVLLDHGDDDWRGHNLPTAILPPDAKEGSWLKLSIKVTPPPPGAKAPQLRGKDGRRDKGGDIIL